MLRRFVIWSVLAVVVGLALAIGGFWAYDHFWARFQPVTIQRGQADIQRVLDESSWVSGGGGGQPLYIVGYRDSAQTLAYVAEQGPVLRAAGVEPRVLMFARPDREGAAQSTPAERATVAELWLNRDWTLFSQWTAGPANAWTAPGVAPADGNMARTAVVEASRQFAERLSSLLKRAGVRADYPLVIWRDRQGYLKACACTDKRSWAFIRDDFGARNTIAVDDAAPIEATPSDTVPAPGVQPLPYPTLPPAPGSTPAPAPGAAPVVPPATKAPAPAPRPANPPRPNGPPPPVEEDTTFY